MKVWAKPVVPAQAGTSNSKQVSSILREGPKSPLSLRERVGVRVK